jgi:hypothetical protein
MRAWTNRTPRVETSAGNLALMRMSGGDEENESNRDRDRVRREEEPDWFLDLENGESRRHRISIW